MVVGSKASRPSLEESFRMVASSADSEGYESDNGVKDQLDDAETRRLIPEQHPEGATNVHLNAQRTSGIWSYLAPTKTCCSLCALFFIAVLALLAVNLWMFWKAPMNGQSPPWYPTPKGGTARDWKDSYAKAAAMVEQMTLVEKVNITTGLGWAMGLCVGNTGPVERLGFPSLCLQDGPLGIRFADNVTAFPAGITVAATWDRELMFQRGKAHGHEAYLKGINVLLGPAMGPVGRSPLGGRNWEGFGSDPVLQGIAAAETIKGIQSEGVMATAKHFIGNEQEHFRTAWEWGIPNAVSSNIDDRTLHEMYAWPFQDSIRAGVASIMCSYNQVNNSYACQNSKLMNGILKDEFGFQGWIQSDWVAQHAGVASANAGLDVTMPGDGIGTGVSLWGSHLTTMALNGSVPIERLNDMVTRVVAAWYQLGQDDKSVWDASGPNFSSWTKDAVGKIHEGSDDETTAIVNKFVNAQGDHAKLARKIAAEGTVLLKNTDNFLPLKRSGWPQYKSKIKAARYQIGVFGSDAFPDPKGPNSCVDRACNTWTLGSGWGSGAVDFPYLISPWGALDNDFKGTEVQLNPFKKHSFNKEEFMSMRKQNLCLVFLNSDGGEGYKSWESVKGDRNDLFAQNGGDQYAQTIADNCGNGSGDVVVIIHAIGPVSLESFIDKPNVKAVLFANLPGEESGNALGDVLFGDVNPGGRLPFTIGKKLKDYGDAAKIITKVTPNHPIPQANFTEGLLIDYRHFDHFDIDPRFEFGFGLSYTSFELSDTAVRKLAELSPFPNPRPDPAATPPAYSTDIPDARTALFPKPFRQLKKYIYPYISSTKGIKFRLPVPVIPSPLSPAGGAPGGNPSLYDVLLGLSATVKNTGSVAGSTVIQLYVSFPPSYVDAETHENVTFPVKVLRNFQKVRLEAGASSNVELNLTRRDLSYWSTIRQNWVIPDGEFTLKLGFSSRDLPMTYNLSV